MPCNHHIRESTAPPGPEVLKGWRLVRKGAERSAFLGKNFALLPGGLEEALEGF